MLGNKLLFNLSDALIHCCFEVGVVFESFSEICFGICIATLQQMCEASLRVSVCEAWRETSYRPAPYQASAHRNAFSDYRSRNLEEEVAGRIIEIQGERTAVGVAPIAKHKRFV